MMPVQDIYLDTIGLDRVSYGHKKLPTCIFITKLWDQKQYLTGLHPAQVIAFWDLPFISFRCLSVCVWPQSHNTSLFTVTGDLKLGNTPPTPKTPSRVEFCFEVSRIHCDVIVDVWTHSLFEMVQLKTSRSKSNIISCSL